eukprot:2002650-Pyramimonas_sp.AAC.1
MSAAPPWRRLRRRPWRALRAREGCPAPIQEICADLPQVLLSMPVSRLLGSRPRAMLCAGGAPRPARAVASERR